MEYSKTQHFCFLLVDEFSHIAFSCAIEPLRIANLISGKELYKWSYISENGKDATCSNSTVTLVHYDYHTIPPCDRLFLLSGINVHNHFTDSLRACLRREVSRNIPLGALCSAAYLLAKGGYLRSLRAAIHWEYHDGFMEEFPDVNLVRNVFVADEQIITASGGTATADLMLHLIERKYGYDLSVAVADQMVYNAVRDATADQRVSLQSRHGMRNPHLSKAIGLMMESIETPISLNEIADELGISKRQVERLFGRFLNCSPKKYYVELRLQRAQHLLLQTDRSVTEVALACGFESPGYFSRVYRAAFGVLPSHQSAKIS